MAYYDKFEHGERRFSGSRSQSGLGRDEQFRRERGERFRGEEDDAPRRYGERREDGPAPRRYGERPQENRGGYGAPRTKAPSRPVPPAVHDDEPPVRPLPRRPRPKALLSPQWRARAGG